MPPLSAESMAAHRRLGARWQREGGPASAVRCLCLALDSLLPPAEVLCRRAADLVGLPSVGTRPATGYRSGGGTMITRRTFLKLTGASTITWFVATNTDWTGQAMAQIPGGT